MVALAQTDDNTRSLSLQRQVEVIRREIAETGESIVGCEELRVLCGDVVEPYKQSTTIALIATYEGWSFVFYPDRHHVRFAMLPHTQ